MPAPVDESSGVVDNIENEVEKLIQNLCAHRRSSCKFTIADHRDIAITFDESFETSPSARNVTLNFFSYTTRLRFVRTVFCLDKIHFLHNPLPAQNSPGQLVVQQDSRMCSMRELYYQGLSAGLSFARQKQMDDAIRDAQCLLRCTRGNLKVHATPNGLAAGDIRFLEVDNEKEKQAPIEFAHGLKRSGG